MQAQAASRLDHIEARVTFTAAGATGSRLVSIWDQTRTWDPGARGLSPPGPGTPYGRIPTSLCAAVSSPAGRYRELSTDSHPRPARVVFVV